MLCDTADIFCCVTQQTVSAVSHSRHCLLCDTADIVCCVTQQSLSAVSHSRQCLLCGTADTSVVSHSRQYLLCHTADTSPVSHSRYVCCVTQLNAPKSRYFVGHPRTAKFNSFVSFKSLGCFQIAPGIPTGREPGKRGMGKGKREEGRWRG